MRNPRVRACDLFCGAGGSSTGLLRACQRLGLEVQLVAVNHWKEAIDTHELNHPGVYHLHEDLAAIDPRRALADAGLGTTLDLLWASPECTSFSYSRGGRPISEQSRASAWHPLKWCDQLNVKMFVIENVPAFRSWGPTDRNHRPIKARRGETYRQYLDLFRAMGYTVEARVLNAADYGAAQTRKRLFIIGVKGARPIRWPQPSHAPVGSIAPGLQPWRGAKEIIDWSVRGTSIFNRKKPHARKTLGGVDHRIAERDRAVTPGVLEHGMPDPRPGARRLVLERILIGGEKYWPALRPYLPILRNHLLARDVDDPLPTVMATGTHIGLAEPVLVQVSHGDHSGRVRPVSEPLGTVTGAREAGLAEALVVTVAHGDGNGRGNSGRVRSAATPLVALTGSPELGIAEPIVVGTEFSKGNGHYVRSSEDPLATLTSRGGMGVAEPFLMVNRTNNVPRSVDDPLPCLNTGNHLGIVEPFIIPQRTFENMTADDVNKPLRTLTTKQHPALIEPFVTKYHGDHAGRADGSRRSRSLDEPLGTVDVANRFGLVEPVVTEGIEETPAGPGVLIPFNGEGPGQRPRSHSVDEPLPTITTGGAGQKGLAQSVLLKYSRTGGVRSVAQPLDTLTAKPRYGVVTPAVAARLDSLPLGSLTPLGIKIGPELYLDILFRMLRVHELGQGQGFRREYQFTGTVEEQIKQIGNAVEVHQAEALCFTALASFG